ncbi:hypothetical protein FGO68_gene15184 [Halteria grandinella]|uniref:Uncharacterized protein n=1 Tax=Halteria grandinella TaxID=5974 RepID=A0A8J8NT56_HALGN|nr:hypothetical protein FGO68_gene15184 [Halteria grandinella]
MPRWLREDRPPPLDPDSHLPPLPHSICAPLVVAWRSQLLTFPPCCVRLLQTSDYWMRPMERVSWLRHSITERLETWQFSCSAEMALTPYILIFVSQVSHAHTSARDFKPENTHHCHEFHPCQ